MSSRAPQPQTRSPLLRRVERACDDVLDRGGPAVASDVLAVRTALSDPVRLAVVGRIKAGKSTLVNALIGRRVAPTKAGECTRVVTWYRYGSPDQAHVVLTDGSTRALRFDGALPEDIGFPVDVVERVEVRLQAGALRELTIIDTPGLATATAEHEQATRRALLGEPTRGSAAGVSSVSRTAATQADAVLFLMRDAERQDEVEFLRDFHAAAGDLSGGAVNAVGLLSHADGFGAGGWGQEDPVDLAREHARRLGVQRAAELSEVHAVSGLLAQTVRTGRIREADARALAGLAGADDIELRLWERLGQPDGLEPQAVARLFQLLGPYGVATGRAHAGAGTGLLLDWLEERSGIAGVEELIRRRFVMRADLLKADHALKSLDRIAESLRQTGDSGRAGTAVQALVEEARLEPELHPVREVRALGLLAAVAPGSPLLATLVRLTEGAGDADRVGCESEVVGAELGRQARRCGALAQAATSTATSSAEAEAARTAARSFMLIARRAEGLS